jgi:hypothetical protein
MIQSFPGDPNQHLANVVYLFLRGSHYQRIITADRRYSVIDHDTLTVYHSSNDECRDMYVSIVMDLSLQDDLATGRIDVEESLSITEESTSNLHCQLCNDDSNSL